MTTHTRSPWTYGLLERADNPGHLIEANEGHGQMVIAFVHGINKGSTANARLIAKAPDMREALAGLFEHCAMIHKHWGDGNNAKEAEAAIERGRALLAEIKGGANVLL